MRVTQLKKTTIIMICFLILIFLFLLSYNYNEKIHPKIYYNVYLDDQLLGVISSEEQLKNYINNETEHIINIIEETKEYCPITKEDKTILETAEKVIYYKKDNEECATVTTKVGTDVDKIYNPSGLRIEATLTYKENTDSIEEIYEKIFKTKSFTVKGYQFTVKEEDKTSYIYTLSKDIFEDATIELIKTYVGEEKYGAYINNIQTEIKTTGAYIENVYIQENINVKEVQIPISEKIYTDSNQLSHFLLFGNNPKTSSYKVKENEMIEDIAFVNQISVEEFLISNNKYRDSKSLIAVGTEVQIKETNPQLKVVVESYVVEDKTNEYKTVYQYDDTHYIGYSKTIQKGQHGLERIKQTEQVINGITIYVEPKEKEILKASIDEIVIKGDKFVPSVGDLSNWAWPSESGWTISSNYAWRKHPITEIRSFHPAIDIAGTGYNSHIYAANNGTVIIREGHYSFGNYIVINHNNGYYTLYAHLSKFVEGVKVNSVVSRGQLIGYVGSTGESTGPHIHFEVWKDCRFCRISPWTIYR